MKSDPLQKHDDECIERRTSHPKLLLVCTCGLTFDQVKGYSAFAAEFSDKGSKDDESRP